MMFPGGLKIGFYWDSHTRVRTKSIDSLQSRESGQRILHKGIVSEVGKNITGRYNRYIAIALAQGEIRIRIINSVISVLISTLVLKTVLMRVQIIIIYKKTKTERVYYQQPSLEECIK